MKMKCLWKIISPFFGVKNIFNSVWIEWSWNKYAGHPCISVLDLVSYYYGNYYHCCCSANTRLLMFLFIVCPKLLYCATTLAA